MYLFCTNRQKNIRCKLFVQYKSAVPNLGNLPFKTILYIVYYITFTDHVCCIGCRDISRAGLLFILACNHRPNYNKIRLLEFPILISLNIFTSKGFVVKIVNRNPWYGKMQFEESISNFKGTMFTDFYML